MHIHFVSAANSRYFRLVQQWAVSVVQALDTYYGPSALAGTPTPSVSIKILDLGLHDFERNALAQIPGDVRVIPVESSDSGFYTDLATDTPFARSMIGFLDRCRLPTLLGADSDDAVIWMDADTYVHEAEVLVDLIHLVENGRAFAVPEIDRAYAVNPHHLTISAGWARGNYTKFFGTETADALTQLPMINSGVVGAPAAHGLWTAWESAVRFALMTNEGRPDFGIDQVALNFAAYLNARDLVHLDSTYNWCVTHASPVLDTEGRLCHPVWPHTPLKIVHLLDNLKWARVGVPRVNLDLSAPPRGGDAMHLDFEAVGQHSRSNR